jgi:hypothetical protein
MKKLALLLFMFLFAGGYSIAQTEYPLVTVQQIMGFADSTHALFPSPLVNDTVRVQGAVLVRPTISNDDRRSILYVGARYATYIQSADYQPWGGLNVITNDTVASQATLMPEVCDTATICEFTGVVTTYSPSTELILIPNIPIKPILSLDKRATPIPINLEDLWTTPGTTPNYNWQKYNGMYVSLTSDVSHTLITSNRTTGTSSSSGKFQINDQNGNYVVMYPASKYFKNAPLMSLTDGGYVPPTDGSYISYIRGLLIYYVDSYGTKYYEIEPIYPGDIGPTLISPPSIASVKRDVAIIKKNQAVTVTATVKATSASVSSVKIFYNLNGVADSVSMTKGTTDTTLFTGVIPACTADSSYVSFYVKASDLNNLSVTSPANINTSRYSYFALDRDLTVKEIRYSPFGSGYSGYNSGNIAGSKLITLTGTVICDTSDLPGNHGSNPARVYMQNGSGSWSGIMLGTAGDLGTQVITLSRGDNVTVTGQVVMSAYGTKIDTLTSLVVNSHGNPMPTPTVLTTGACGTSTLGVLTGEPYSGTLVTYQNVSVDSANADGPLYNYGEQYVTDGSTHSRIIWSDGGTTYCNDGTRATTVKIGDKFTSVTGVLGYTHSNYKLCPRKNEDVLGYKTDIKRENDLRAASYSLKQNFPNPFNPSTTISYSIPTTGLVTLKVYDVLGREVQTLVNQVQQNGNYRVSFNASSMPSGIYFYNLTSNNFSQVKKMILIK